MSGLGLIPGGSKKGRCGLGSSGERNLLLRKSGEPTRECMALSLGLAENWSRRILKRKREIGHLASVVLKVP